jgi:hypothetical protein
MESIAPILKRKGLPYPERLKDSLKSLLKHHAMKMYGDVESKLHALLTSALMVVSGQLHLWGNSLPVSIG